MDIFFSVCLGLGLAAACGFRIFVPFLVMNLAAQAGMLDLSSGFEWIASTPTLVVLVVATALEIGAYYVPWLDNFLDLLATPAAIIAGVVATAAAVGDVSPLLKWSLAVVAGAGAAGVVQGITATARQASSWSTAGLANPLLSTVEAFGSVALSVLAILAPFAAAALVILAVALLGKKLRAWFSHRVEGTPTLPASPSGAGPQT